MVAASGLRVAAAQYPIDFLGSWDAYREKLGRWIGDAAAQGAQLLVFPEYGGMELASLFPQDVHGSLIRQLPALQELVPDVVALHAELARRHGVHVLAASLPVRDSDGRYRNRAWLFTPRGAQGFQDKLMMTRFETETWGVSPGQGVWVFDTALGRIGVSVCYDIEFPLIARRQAEAGADLILAPSCTDTMAGYHRVRIGARARALENQCFAVQAPTVGMAEWSSAVDINIGAAGIYGPPDRGLPEDGVIAAGAMSQPQWLFADLDRGALAAVRADGQVFNHRDWPGHATQAAGPAELVRL